MYARYALAFLVTIPLSLAPLLGKLPIPGFTALLQVFPLNLREGLIAFGGLSMALPAVAVQAYYAAIPRREVLRRWLLITLTTSLLLLAALYTVYTLVVIQVPYFGGDRYAAYVVGTQMNTDCICARRGKDISECVGALLSFSPARVESCYASREIRQNKLMLGLAYLLLLACVGANIGLLTLADAPRANRKHIKRN